MNQHSRCDAGVMQKIHWIIGVSLVRVTSFWLEASTFTIGWTLEPRIGLQHDVLFNSSTLLTLLRRNTKSHNLSI